MVHKDNVVAKEIGDYLVEGVIAQTQASCILRACKKERSNEVDGLAYAIKQNLLPSMISLQDETRIMQEIANYAPRSIVIPMTMWTEEGSGTEYAVMQFKSDGMFLSDIIRYYEEKGQNVPLELQLDLIGNLLSALDCLHGFRQDDAHQGYLHMDLHPGNIFYENADLENKKAGSAKFIDFSNAVPIRKGTTAAVKELLGVTPGYSAPEKYLQHSRIVAVGTDLYSVAAIAARMLTGRVILDHYQDYTMFLEQDCLKSLNPVLRYAFIGFLRKGLNKNAGYRYKTCEDMLRALRDIQQIYTSFQRCEYYDILSLSYEMHMPVEMFTEEGMPWDDRQFERAVYSLDNDMHQRVIRGNRQVYIFEGLHCLAMRRTKDHIPVRTYQKLMMNGIACYNHVAESSLAVRCFEELREMGEIPFDEYLDMLPKIVETYKDMCLYAEAEKILEDVICALEQIETCHREIIEARAVFAGCLEREIVLGRAYSSMGTLKTVLHEKGALELYKKALEEFEESDTENRKITMSHILHSAVEFGDQELYERYAPLYFVGEESTYEGNNSVIEEWFQYAYGELQRVSNAFPFFTFIKGFHWFYAKQAGEEWLSRLEKVISEGELEKLWTYPANLIYKHIGLVLYEQGGEKYRECAVDAMQKAIKKYHPEGLSLEKKFDILAFITYDIGLCATAAMKKKEENKLIFELLSEHSSQPGWEKVKGMLEDKKKTQKGLITGILTGEYA